MRPPQRILTFLVCLSLIYMGLLLSWNVVGPAYAAAFRSAGTFFFGGFGSDATVRFEPLPNADSDRDTRVLLRDFRNYKQGEFEISSRYLGYLPMTMAMALIAATPLALRRRVTAMLFGLALVHVFIAARLWVVLLRSFSDPNSVTIYHPGPIGRGILEFLMEVLYVSLVGGFVGPIIIWMIVCLRPRTWRTIFGDANRPQDIQRA